MQSKESYPFKKKNLIIALLVILVLAKQTKPKQTKTNEVETGNIKGTFTFEAGSRFNDLPNQLRQIDCYKDFSKNARNFYYDCAMARILQESN